MADIDYSIKDIEKVLTVDGTIKNVDVSRLTAPGENYLSLVLKVDFNIEKDGENKTLSTVAKRLPLGERKGLDFNSKVMTNEIKWYKDISTLIEEFGKTHGIEDVDFFPELLGSRYSLDPATEEADKDSVLLLKNLIPEGYQNEDRYKGFDLVTSKACIRKLATFQSIPLAMKIKNPEQFEIIKKYLAENLPPGPPEGENGEKNFGPPPGEKHPNDLLLEKIMSWPECQPYIEKLKSLKEKPKSMDLWFKPGIEPWTTIIHNDFWVNNIMVNYKDREEPLVKIVDFQMLSQGSYAKDLIFFLLTSVQNDILKERIDELIRYYYDVFTENLKKTDFPLTLSYDEFLKELERAANESSFNHALFFSTIVFGEKGTGIDAALQEFNPFAHMTDMINKMNDHQREKLITITAVAAERNWL